MVRLSPLALVPMSVPWCVAPVHPSLLPAISVSPVGDGGGGGEQRGGTGVPGVCACVCLCGSAVDEAI
jgi:hypothetical protein